MTHLFKQDIEEILAKYSLSVQELIAGVTPFNDGQEAPRYRNSATQDLLALIHKACNKSKLEEIEALYARADKDPELR